MSRRACIEDPLEENVLCLHFHSTRYATRAEGIIHSNVVLNMFCVASRKIAISRTRICKCRQLIK